MLGMSLPLPRIDVRPFQFADAPKIVVLGPDWFETQARPAQRPPEGDWLTWVLLAGRGYGKTRVLVEWAKKQAKLMPKSWGAVVAATAADVRDVLVEGPAGFLATADDDFRPTYEPSKRRLTWPNGTRATLFSADEPNRLRGPQHFWGICDEYAAWRYPGALDMLMFGMRLGKDPRVVIATTPRPTPEVKALMTQPGTVVTRGTTFENLANLAPAFRERIIAKYEGTRLGRQELNAEILEDIEGALWQQAWIDADRVMEPPPLTTIVVAVDPKASQLAISETGIVVVGRSIDRHYYVLGDYSLDGLPEQWAEAVAFAYKYHEANYVVAEKNNGGDMVQSILKATDMQLPVELVWASRGKQTRAEPVVALYQQHKVHHVGVLSGLEDQICNWVPAEGASPDRGDALVWGISQLMETKTVTIRQNKVRGRGGDGMVRRSTRHVGKGAR